jgi:hypothetical protein
MDRGAFHNSFTIHLRRSDNRGAAGCEAHGMKFILHPRNAEAAAIEGSQLAAR